MKAFLAERFRERIFKISLSSGCSCPNRDGTSGRAGCSFCHVEALLPSTAPVATPSPDPIPKQLEEGLAYLQRRHRAQRAIAYFQNGTNTHAPAASLAPRFREAIAHPSIVGLSVSTRPDCIAPEHIALFRELASRTLLWVELGLQSAHDATLASIRRGHTAEDFRRACAALGEAGIRTCAHIILGLPGETPAMMRETARFLNDAGIWGVKVHNLHVLSGTEMERRHRGGHVAIPSLGTYAGWVVDVLEELSPEIVVHRVTGHSPRRLTVAPTWSVNKLAVMNAVEEELVRRDSWQGKNYENQQRRASREQSEN